MQAVLSSQLELAQWGTSHTVSAVEALNASVSTAAARAAHEAATHIVQALLPSATGGGGGRNACDAAVAAILDAVKTTLAAFTVSGGDAGCCLSPCAPASAFDT